MRNLDDYIENLKKPSGKRLEFPEIKREIDDLLSKEAHIKDFEPKIFDDKAYKEQSDSLMELKFIISKLKEKTDINEKLESLSYYLGQLRYSLFSKDKKSLKKAVDKFLRDEHTNIRDLLSQIKEFKSEIKNMEATLKEMNQKVPLDSWLSHANYIESQIKLLNRIQQRQNNIALNIGRLFVKTAKKSIRK
ncbi:hypothetical protein ACFLZX_02015 [Nanoarchaeota archaeon]